MGTRGFQEEARSTPQQNWKDVAKKDLKKMDISWDEVEEDRRSWRNRVAQCIFDVGLTRNAPGLARSPDVTVLQTSVPAVT